MPMPVLYTSACMRSVSKFTFRARPPSRLRHTVSLRTVVPDGIVASDWPLVCTSPRTARVTVCKDPRNASLAVRIEGAARNDMGAVAHVPGLKRTSRARLEGRKAPNARTQYKWQCIAQTQKKLSHLFLMVLMLSLRATSYLRVRIVAAANNCIYCHGCRLH